MRFGVWGLGFIRLRFGALGLRVHKVWGLRVYKVWGSKGLGLRVQKVWGLTVHKVGGLGFIRFGA